MGEMATYLDKILARHREAANADKRDVSALVAEARNCAPATGVPARPLLPR